MGQLMNSRSWLSLIAILLITRLAAAIWLPPFEDEAYYFTWSHFLDFGYFDHPPVVAWLSIFKSALGFSPLGHRFGTFLLALAIIPIYINLCRKIFSDDSSKLWNATILFSCTLVSVILGFLTTPDIPLAFFWVLTLHEAYAALNRQPARWLSCGMSLGLGMMSKYTMVLMGPVLLVALLSHPKHLRTKWPYLGALLFVLTMLPHLLWLQSNDWVTVRFQFERGFKSAYNIALAKGTDLPPAQSAIKGDKEWIMAQYFKDPRDKPKVDKPKVDKPVKSLARKMFDRVMTFLGGQIGLWGFLVLPVFLGFFQKKNQSIRPLKTEVATLLHASWLIPLGFFAIISPFQDIEANWPAMYLVGASLVIGLHFQLRKKLLFGTALANILVVALLVVMSNRPALVSSSQDNRLLKETQGYHSLAQYLSDIPQPIFVDTYQNASQLYFHSKGRIFQQWPAIARNSEFIRRIEFNPIRWQDLLQQERFYIVSDNFVPAKIPNFELEMLSEALACNNGDFFITDHNPEKSYLNPCLKVIHRWTLARYSQKSG